MPRKLSGPGPLLIANWKMQLTIEAAVELAKEIRTALRRVRSVAEIVLCPSLTALDAVQTALRRTPFRLGAQNMFWDEQGAYTGEVSPLMLREVGVSHVLIGHSERRQVLHEDDVMIARKMLSAVSHGLRPVLCVGETVAERAEGRQERVIAAQLTSALRSLPPPHGDAHLNIAYEPVWAIGTGAPASLQQALNMKAFIQHELVERFGSDFSSERIRVLYGGSVDAENVTDYVGPGKFDGALVGSASLKADSFVTMVKHINKYFSYR